MHLPAAKFSAGLEASDMLSAAHGAAELIEAVCEDGPAHPKKDTSEGLLYSKPALVRSGLICGRCGTPAHACMAG